MCDVCTTMAKYKKDVPEEYTDYERQLALTIGVRIRQQRKKLKLTQAQVRIRMETESVSVTRAKFSRIEKGDALANAAEIVSLVAALEVSYHWLLEGKDESEQDSLGLKKGHL